MPHLPLNSICPNVMGGLNCIYPDCSCYEKPDSELTKLKAVAGEMERALDLAAQRFRRYEALHMEKGTADGQAKAASNAMMASKMEATLLSYRALKG